MIKALLSLTLIVFAAATSLVISPRAIASEADEDEVERDIARDEQEQSAPAVFTQDDQYLQEIVDSVLGD